MIAQQSPPINVLSCGGTIRGDLAIGFADDEYPLTVAEIAPAPMPGWINATTAEGEIFSINLAHVSIIRRVASDQEDQVQLPRF